MKYRFRDGDLKEDKEWLSCEELQVGGLYGVTPKHPVSLPGRSRLHVEYLGYIYKESDRVRKYEFRICTPIDFPVKVIQYITLPSDVSRKFFKVGHS
jgi:hypothetical protein